MISLRKILFSVFFSVAALLAIVVILGLLQYRFTREYDAIIYQGEKILFRFDSLREHLTRIMISGETSDAEAISGKLDALNSDISRLLENTMVPGEYKLALINQVDLQSITLSARKVVQNPEDRDISLELYDQLVVLANNLMQFDRVLTGQMRTRLVRFQGLAIGALTLIIASVSLLVLFIYQKALVPLISLVQYLEQPDHTNPLPVGARSCKEIAELTNQVNLMVAEGVFVASQSGVGKGGFTLSPKDLNKLSNSLNGIINYTQLLIDEGVENDDEEGLELLTKIRESGEHMGAIIQNRIGGKKTNE